MYIRGKYDEKCSIIKAKAMKWKYTYYNNINLIFRSTRSTNKLD